MQGPYEIVTGPHQQFVSFDENRDISFEINFISFHS